VDEPETEGGQRSVLVIVPDSQLSLAIGKRGQNARLAAKLTGLRVDIKSESEIEDERRRDEEERTEGREILAQFPDVGSGLLDTLVEAGLYSPARIVRAGAERLQALPDVGEKRAVALVEASQAWMAEHVALPEAGEAAVADTEPVAGAGQSPGPDESEHDPAPRAPVE
jgi:N utilization substance protein A